VAYIKGELNSTERVSFNRAYDASLRTLKDMGYTVTEQRTDAQRGSLTARPFGESRMTNGITIKLNNREHDSTEMSIRVGLFGDEARSREILKRIRSHY
jgi:hypothetical protein